MNALWQVAWREYHSYVATWGFWISLALIPLFMSIGFIFPLLAQQSEPTRYMAVIAQDAGFEASIVERLQNRQQDNARAAVLALVRTQLDASLTEADVRAIFAESESWEEARAVLLERASPTLRPAIDALGNFTGKLRVVEAPARDAESLRPYLLGETLIETGEGPQPLHAAAIIRNVGDKVEIDYWSAQITNRDARSAVDSAVRAQMRRDRLGELGVFGTEADALLNARPTVRDFSPEKERESARVSMADRAPYIVAFGMSLMLWFAIFSIISMLLSSTVEEKSNNILDSLLATVRLRDILLGKLLGVAMVSFTLLAVWGLVGTAGLGAAQSAANELPAALLSALADPKIIFAFIVYFVIGYLMYGAAFIAIGSLCESMQEAQTLMSPIIIFLLGPIFALTIAINNPDGWLMKGLAWFPLYTPFVMPLRLPGEVSLLEIGLTTLAMLVTTWLILQLAVRVFHAGAVSGATPTTIIRQIGKR
jgi:ABC-2 type transport system permease protein